MLKTKLYTGSISNLTDARYFAAWYPEWMGFDMEKCLSGKISIEEIAAIMGWVDVHQFVAEFSGLEEPKVIVDLVTKYEFDAIKVGPYCPRTTLKEINEKFIFKEIIFENTTSLSSLSQTIEHEREWVDRFIIKAQNNCQTHYLEEYFTDIQFYFDIPDILSFLKKGILDSKLCEGILVKGGEEEKVGVKSFEDYDEIYDFLMD